MKKTLLLCYIHGFKGGESTFGHNYAFTHDLGRQVAKALPRINVQVSVYPKYETKGDLAACVNRFREWLLNKVIDIEVAAGTPSPTIDPSVRVILIGHSMGGIVAAETAILIASEQPIHGTGPDPADDKDITGSSSSNRNNKQQQVASPAPSSFPPPNSNMFPYIQGVLAFDTPFLGISPGVVAHGAESHYATASSAFAQISSLTGLWGGAKAAEADAAVPSSPRKVPVGALPAPPAAAKEDGSSGNNNNNNNNKKSQPPLSSSAAAGNSWGKWSTIAMVAGAVGAVAASGAAAYYHRDNINAGWTWASSHLEFVGCLARKEELRRRVACMVRLRSDLGMGFANLYTRLDRTPAQAQAGVVGALMGGDGERTFCVVPRREPAGDWIAAPNRKATDETMAHMTMFEPKENPEYGKLVRDATSLMANWLQNDWYKGSLKNDGS